MLLRELALRRALTNNDIVNLLLGQKVQENMDRIGDLLFLHDGPSIRPDIPP